MLVWLVGAGLNAQPVTPSTPALCRLLPSGVGYDPNGVTSLDEDLSHFVWLRAVGRPKCGDPCVTGIDIKHDTRGVLSGFRVELYHLGSREHARFILEGGGARKNPPIGRDYGDASSVWPSQPNGAALAFIKGSIYAELSGYGTYAARIPAYAREVESKLQSYSQDCNPSGNSGPQKPEILNPPVSGDPRTQRGGQAIPLNSQPLREFVLTGNWTASDGSTATITRRTDGLFMIHYRYANGNSGVMVGRWNGQEFRGRFATLNAAGVENGGGEQVLRVQSPDRLEGPWTNNTGATGVWSITRR